MNLDRDAGASLTLLGKLAGTRIVVSHDPRHKLRPYDTGVYADGGGRIAFACGEYAHLAGDEDGDWALWIGGACVGLRSQDDARRVAGTLGIPMPAARTEAA